MSSNNFAKMLNKLRLAKGWSMQTLKEKSNVSTSMICKIEREEVQPTLDVAGKLAKAFGKTLSEMLHTPQDAKTIFLPKDEQAVWKDGSNFVRRNISPIFERLKIEWLHIEIPAHSSLKKAACSKPLELYLLAIKDNITVKIIQQQFLLTPGDSLYLENPAEHELLNESDSVAEYYIIVRYI